MTISDFIEQAPIGKVIVIFFLLPTLTFLIGLMIGGLSDEA